jgi:hypothetical protein
MRNRLLVLGLLLAVFVGAIAYWRSDRRRILARLGEAEAAMAKSGEEDQLTSFGKVRDVVELFAPGFLVTAQPYQGSISDRQELAGVIHGYRSGLGRLKLTHGGLTLSVDHARGTAEMGLVVTAAFDRGDGPQQQQFRFRLGWMKDRGTWLVHDCELLEASGQEGPS